METVYKVASEQQTTLEQQTDQTRTLDSNDVLIFAIAGIVILFLAWIFRRRITSFFVSVLNIFKIEIGTSPEPNYSRDIKENKMNKDNTIHVKADDTKIEKNRLNERNQIIVDSDDSEHESSEKNDNKTK